MQIQYLKTVTFPWQDLVFPIHSSCQSGDHHDGPDGNLFSTMFEDDTKKFNETSFPIPPAYRVGSEEIVFLEASVEEQVSRNSGYKEQTNERDGHGKGFIGEKLTTGSDFVIVVKRVLDSNKNGQI